MKGKNKQKLPELKGTPPFIYDIEISISEHIQYSIDTLDNLFVFSSCLHLFQFIHYYRKKDSSPFSTTCIDIAHTEAARHVFNFRTGAISSNNAARQEGQWQQAVALLESMALNEVNLATTAAKIWICWR